MVVSISSALAPGRLALTLTVGESVFGIRSRPSSPYETTPSTMSATLIMMAKTGRLTLTSASFNSSLLAGRGGRGYRRPRAFRRRSLRLRPPRRSSR